MRLKELRKKANKTQQEIAEYLYVVQTTYSKYEKEQLQIPIKLLMRLADYYEVSVDYIIGRTDI